MGRLSTSGTSSSGSRCRRYARTSVWCIRLRWSDYPGRSGIYPQPSTPLFPISGTAAPKAPSILSRSSLRAPATAHSSSHQHRHHRLRTPTGIDCLALPSTSCSVHVVAWLTVKPLYAIYIISTRARWYPARVFSEHGLILDFALVVGVRLVFVYFLSVSIIDYECTWCSTSYWPEISSEVVFIARF